MKPILTLALTSVASVMVLSLASVEAQTYPSPSTDVRSMEEIDMPQEMMGEEETSARSRHCCEKKCNKEELSCGEGCVGKEQECMKKAGKDKTKQQACRATFDTCDFGCGNTADGCRDRCKKGE